MNEERQFRHIARRKIDPDGCLTESHNTRATRIEPIGDRNLRHLHLRMIPYLFIFQIKMRRLRLSQRIPITASNKFMLSINETQFDVYRFARREIFPIEILDRFEEEQYFV